MREGASQEWAKCQRGSSRLNSKRLTPPVFCWWRQNTLKQSAPNKRTWAGGPKATWLIHTELHGSISGGQGIRGEAMVLGEGRGSGMRGHCSAVLVCCSTRHSGTVDVQRLAVLPWSMEHAEAHTFFQWSWGVVMGTRMLRTDTWPKSWSITFYTACRMGYTWHRICQNKSNKSWK